MADITSYDYDAVMDEAGDPNNPKYQLVKDVIEQHFKLTAKPLPPKQPKMTLPAVPLAPMGILLSATGRRYLGRPHGSAPASSPNPLETVITEAGQQLERIIGSPEVSSSISSEKPITFEAINQYSGLVLYETDLPDFQIDPTLLKVNGLRDRALVYVDDMFAGILSRENAIDSLPINKSSGKRLQILVENQGRINFNIANDTKVYTIHYML